MRQILRAKGVTSECIVGPPLDNLESALTLVIDPQVPFLGADAAVAFSRRGNLGQLHLVDKGLAVAIAPVCSQRLVGLLNGATPIRR